MMGRANTVAGDSEENNIRLPLLFIQGINIDDVEDKN